MSRVYVSGAFDNPRSSELRIVQEASRLGPVTLILWPDETIRSVTGKAPAMSLPERRYYFESSRYVDRTEAAPEGVAPDQIGRELGVELFDPRKAELSGFPYEAPPLDGLRVPGRKRVIATGCYDWLHTGHLRFFEEASEYGELNVVIGSDANVRLLKGEGHPLFSQEERRFVVGSFKAVARCLVSTGSGWLDAEPEIRALEAERYVVNEDGDKPEKRRYCEEQGIEYIVLKRTPKEGLPRRSSTDLRGY
jgi:cytidyltransferase-like protein